ncbi:hypothetical protein D1610_16705 [Sphingomonas gilva]|uniref:Tetratricopeptide repeat protein n=1 Tax=Sphingomonas gilva TaxID=2305907 RepID=A0A396RRM5_9SPHN|nr:hypothetical protein [Sphingomonas gilva]RHW16251.1 hypothetical protein D1610_16705 [Sphingomonas gilva]
MIRISKATLLAAAAFGLTIGAPAAAQEQAPAQPAAKSINDFKLTKEVRNIVAAAQTQMAAGDNAGAIAKLNEALPLSKTADDRYIIGNVMIDAASKANDQANQRRGVDIMIESGAITGAELGKFQFFAGRFSYAAGEYDKALTQLNAAKASGYQDPQMAILIADASLKANKPDGLAMLRQAVEAEVAAGRKPDEAWIKRGLAEAYKGKQADQVAWWAQTSIKHYPTPQNWRNALLIYRDGAKLEPQADLDMLRLMRATKSLTGERDFYEYASSANSRGLPGEAKAVIDEGRAAGAIGGDSAALKEIYTSASGKVKADQASLAAAEKSAATAKDGKAAASTADAYLGYKNYAKAAELYALALTKGGVDANQVNTRLGIALALSGQKPAAKEAFAKVTGPRAGVADYWELYIDQAA